MPDRVYTLHTPNRKSYKIAVNPESLIGKRITSTGEPYEPWLLHHIYAAGFTGTAVDVGAHIGNHTLWFKVACELDVVAFEPISPGRVTENLKLNGLDDEVPVWPCALGKERGWAKDSGDRVLTAVGETEAERSDPTRSEGRIVKLPEGQIFVKPLDDVLLEDVALIKVDVEGMEPEVLMGAKQTISKYRPALFLEARDKQAHLKLEQVLVPMGYEMTNSWSRGTPIERWDPKK